MDQLGEIPIEREDGTMRIMVCQMGGCVGKEVREIKMSTTEKLIQKYDVNLVACMELNFNWSKVNLLAKYVTDTNDRGTIGIIITLRVISIVRISVA